jgi:hypothetical protein
MTTWADHGAHAYGRPRRGREVGRIVLWSGLTNLVLLAALFAGQHLQAASAFGDVERWLRRELGLAAPVAAEQPAAAIDDRSEPAQLSQGKGSLAMTVMTPADTGLPAEAAPAEAPEDFASEEGALPEDGDRLRVSPILRKVPASGKLEIGNFASASLIGSADECLNLGRAMLGDAGGTPDLLHIVADSDEITVARICAANGSVVLTCRADQITVSPRRPRPDDRCRR